MLLCKGLSLVEDGCHSPAALRSTTALRKPLPFINLYKWRGFFLFLCSSHSLSFIQIQDIAVINIIPLANF